jgi:hypothetical protein
MQPVTLHLAITVSANRTFPSDYPQIPAQGDDSLVEEVPKPTVAPDSRGRDQSTALEPSSPPPDHSPIQRRTPIPQDQAEMPLAEKSQAEKSIDGSNTWQGVVEKVKFVMDTLSPDAGVRVLNILFAYPWLSRLVLSAQCDCTDGVWSAFSNSRGAPVCFLVGKKH